MTWTEIIYSIGDIFKWAFGFFEFVQNYFNNILLLNHNNIFAQTLSLSNSKLVKY